MAECAAAGCPIGEGCTAGHPLISHMGTSTVVGRILPNLLTANFPLLRPLVGDSRTALDRARSGAAVRVTAYMRRLCQFYARDSDLLLAACADFGLPPPAPQPASLALDRCAACQRLRASTRGAGGGVCAKCGRVVMRMTQ